MHSIPLGVPHTDKRIVVYREALYQTVKANDNVYMNDVYILFALTFMVSCSFIAFKS